MKKIITSICIIAMTLPTMAFSQNAQQYNQNRNNNNRPNAWVIPAAIIGGLVVYSATRPRNNQSNQNNQNIVVQQYQPLPQYQTSYQLQYKQNEMVVYQQPQQYIQVPVQSVPTFTKTCTTSETYDQWGRIIAVQKSCN